MVSMGTTIAILQVISASAFTVYGLACLFSQKLVVEFGRYKLSSFRVLTGLLEISGAVGLLVGFYIPLLKTLAALGLAALMLCGIAVRIRIKDSLVQIIPALVLFIINSFIFISSV